MLINNAVLTGSFTVNGINYLTNTPTTGSNTYVGTQTTSGSVIITGSLQVTGSISTTGTITAQTLVVQTVTSSVVYSSGSNIFGNQLTDVQQMTGSLRVTGSGNHYILGGNVGIGTTTPNKLGADKALTINGPTDSLLELSVGDVRKLQMYHGGTNAQLNNLATGSLILLTNGISALTLASTGAATFLNSAGITNGNGLNLRAGGNTASDANVLNFTSLAGTINVSMFSDASSSNTRLKSLGNLSFHTGNIAISADNERMTITSGGNVLIGTTSVLSVRELANLQVFNSATIRSTNYYDSLPVLALFSADNTSGGLYVEFNNSVGTRIGSITRDGASNVAYNTSSDIRLKKNIINASLSGVNKINSIQVRSFDWISDDIHQDFGFIAQELINTAPEAVTKGIKEEDIWQVDNSKLIPVLVKAIQELSAKVDAQAAEINELKNK